MIDNIEPEEFLFKIANTALEFNDARNLFLQYSNSLAIDLSFQDFRLELETIHEQYNKPKGALLLVYKDETPIGCVGIRKLYEGSAELKRMFVKTEYRGYGLGQKSLRLILDIAKNLGYEKIFLDTLPNMIYAQKIYRSCGFHETAPYRFNPIDGALFMERRLD